jgi:hypothetical protein
MMPRATSDGLWQLLVDTSVDHAHEHVDQGLTTTLRPRSLKLFLHYIR